MRWGLSLAKGNFAEIDTLLKSLSKLKTKEKAIEKIKAFGVKNNWNVTQNQEVIDDFMFHVLKNFYTKV